MSRNKSVLMMAAVGMAGFLVLLGFLAWPPAQVPRNAQEQQGNNTSSEQYERLQKPSLPENDYAGAAACRTCHLSIWDHYQSHPMSNSSATVKDATELEDYAQQTSFTVPTPIGEIEYRVEKNSEGVFHHESLTDPILGSLYDQRVRIDYAIGSGRHGRSYVFAENDCLYMSPITWYSEESIWHLSPNYRAGKNQRFERRIVLGCLVCHTERVAVNREAPNHFVAPVMLEAKIGCESCHGPGAKHIAWHEQQSHPGKQLTADSDPIINPAKLDPERRESVCWQCHFAAEERIPRYGRLDADFRPGERFDEVWVAFVRGLRLDEEGTMRVASHVEQTQSSVCFQRSGGRFGCLSCHDPHSAPAAQEKELFYRQKCLACHSDRGCSLVESERLQANSTDSCIACHMPSHGLSRIPHTSRTDHRVLRRPQPDLPIDQERPLTIFNPGNRKLPQAEEDRAWGLVLAKIAYLQQNPDLARAARDKLAGVQAAVPDDNRVLEWLGLCEQLLNRPDLAQSRWQEIIRRFPQDEGARQRIADFFLIQGNSIQTKEALSNYLAINPWQSAYQIRHAAVCGSLGLLEEAERSAQKSLRINPTLAPAHRILAEVYQRLGKSDAAARHQALSRRLEPQP